MRRPPEASASMSRVWESDEPGPQWSRPSRWIVLLLVISVVTWRSESIYSGGLDVVVIAKAVLGLLALALAWAARVAIPQGRPMRNTFVWIVVLYTMLSTFGAWTDGQLAVSGVLAIRLLLITFTVALLVKTFERRALLEDLLASFAVIAIMAAVTGLPSLTANGRLHGGVPQMHGNELSLLCALPVIGLLHRTIWRRARGGDIVLLVVLSIALIATGSRTALLTVLAAAVIMLIQARRLGRGVALTIVAMPPLVLLVATRTEALRSFLIREGAGEGDITTLNSRSIVWSAALDHADTPWTELFGSGLAVKQIPVVGQYWTVQNLDSSWVSALVQAGWVGAALLALWIGLLVFSTLRLPREPRMLIQGILLALLIRSVLESGLIDSSPAFTSFLLLSLIASPVASRATPVSHRKPRRSQEWSDPSESMSNTPPVRRL